MMSSRTRFGRGGPPVSWLPAGSLFGIALVLTISGCGIPGPLPPPNPGPPAGSINPVGIFFNRFTGPTGGTEYLQILATSQNRVYLVSTLDGQGFMTLIQTNGNMTIQSLISGPGTATGTGNFTGTGNRNFVLNPVVTIPPSLPQSFAYQDNRIVGTDTGFPLEAAATTPNTAVVGDYDTVVTPVNPETGSALSVGVNETISLSLVGANTLRVTRANGNIYDGIFVTSSRVAFRVVQGAIGRFATFIGSSNNVGLDMAGVMDFAANGDMAATLLFQTRAPRGLQNQTLIAMNGTPAGGPPPPPGPTVPVQVSTQILSSITFQIRASTNPNASSALLVASGTVEASGTLSGSASTSLSVSCDVNSMVLVVTETSTGIVSVSDVVRQPAMYDCNDRIQFIVAGSSGSPFTITDLITPG